MNDGELLLLNLLDNPACDTSRLIYADYLDERGLKGDRERAEFIRVQVELFRRGYPGPLAVRVATMDRTSGIEPVSQSPAALARRLSELLFANAADWFGDPFILTEPRNAGEWATSRGFLNTISLTTAEFMAHAGAIFSRPPVERVVLTDKNPSNVRRGMHEVYGSEGYFDWFPPHGNMFGNTGPQAEQTRLPWKLWELIHSWDLGVGPVDAACAGFITETDARAALSTACITYGRQCAAALRYASATPTPT